MKKRTKIILTAIVAAAVVGIAWWWYRYRWINFIDNNWSGAHTDDFPHSVALVMAGTNPFKVGDTVEVAQTVPFTNVAYEGEAQVVYVKDDIIVLNKPWGISTGPEGGQVRLVER